MVVSDVGSDPITLGGLLASFGKNNKFSGLTEGIITDSYLPPLGDTGNPWIALFKKIHDTYIPTLPFDGNILYGETVGYTFVQAMLKAGRNPTPGGPDQGNQGDMPCQVSCRNFRNSGLPRFGI
jgi:hypothetical protein